MKKRSAYTKRALVMALTRAYHAKGIMLDCTCRYDYKKNRIYWKPVPANKRGGK